METRASLRRQMRLQRRRLSPRQRAIAGRRLARRLAGATAFRQSRTLACFLSADGEIDTAPLIRLAWRRHKRVYLPVLRGGKLRFCLYTPTSRMRLNRYGIREPAAGAERKPRQLDLVLVPLVAFDAAGTRLGMGGGYYDRTFGYLHRHQRWQRPRLVGLAYAFQEVAGLPAEPWDVPLTGVATEKGVRRFRKDKG